MLISEALRGTQQIYVETAPFIYYVKEHPAYIAKMDAIFAPIKALSLRAVASVIALTEVLIQPLRMGDAALIREYRDILLSGETLLLPITVQIANSAAEFRAHYNLRTADALHVASAVDANCDTFLTNDLGLRRVKELNVLVLDELELDLP